MKEDIPGAAVNALTRITNKTVTDYTKSASAPPSTVNIKAVLAPNLAMNGPPPAAVKMIIFTIVLDPISQEVPVLPAAENISPALVKADMISPPPTDNVSVTPITPVPDLMKSPSELLAKENMKNVLAKNHTNGEKKTENMAVIVRKNTNTIALTPVNPPLAPAVAKTAKNIIKNAAAPADITADVVRYWKQSLSTATDALTSSIGIRVIAEQKNAAQGLSIYTAE